MATSYDFQKKRYYYNKNREEILRKAREKTRKEREERLALYACDSQWVKDEEEGKRREYKLKMDKIENKSKRTLKKVHKELFKYFRY